MIEKLQSGIWTIADTLNLSAGHGSGHAEQVAEHAESINIVEHLTNLHSIELFFKKFSLEPLRFDLFGLDMSITKPVLFMWLAGVILFLAFTFAFKGGKLLRNKFAHILEVYILFIRDEVVYPNMGEKDGRRLLPFFSDGVLLHPDM